MSAVPIGLERKIAHERDARDVRVVPANGAAEFQNIDAAEARGIVTRFYESDWGRRAIRDNPALFATVGAGTMYNLLDHFLSLWPIVKAKYSSYIPIPCIATGLLGFIIAAYSICQPRDNATSQKWRRWFLAAAEGMGGVFPFTLGEVLITLRCLKTPGFCGVDINTFLTDLFAPAFLLGLAATYWKTRTYAQKREWSSQNSLQMILVFALDAYCGTSVFSQLFLANAVYKNIDRFIPFVSRMPRQAYQIVATVMGTVPGCLKASLSVPRLIDQTTFNRYAGHIRDGMLWGVGGMLSVVLWDAVTPNVPSQASQNAENSNEKSLTFGTVAKLVLGSIYIVGVGSVMVSFYVFKRREERRNEERRREGIGNVRQLRVPNAVSVGLPLLPAGQGRVGGGAREVDSAASVAASGVSGGAFGVSGSAPAASVAASAASSAVIVRDSVPAASRSVSFSASDLSSEGWGPTSSGSADANLSAHAGASVVLQFDSLRGPARGSLGEAGTPPTPAASASDHRSRPTRGGM